MNENLPILQDAVNYVYLRYNLEVKVVSSDNEMSQIKTKEWFAKKGIDLRSVHQTLISKIKSQRE